MSSIHRSNASIMTLKEIMELGFVAGVSSYTYSSPVNNYTETNSTSKPDGWDGLLDLESMMMIKGSPQHTFTRPESSLTSSMKGELHSQIQGICDGGLASFCKTPSGHVAFDLSNLVSEYSRVDYTVDIYYDTKSSTPCREEKCLQSMENLLSKSSETVIDLSNIRRPPPPILEISEIQAPLDNILSLDVSAEEPRSLGFVKTDALSLETSSSAIILPWAATSKRHCIPALVSICYDK